MRTAPAKTPRDFKATLKRHRADVDQAIARWLPKARTRPGVLHEAMLYSMQAGGKRLRPLLVLAGHALYPSKLDPFPAAVAVECLHTYSLIHDDLPCMDDSDLRRGLPTCHKKFGEATALLAGDALLTYALWLLADAYKKHPPVAAELVRLLGDAAGSQKLIGGQMEDLLGANAKPSAERLDYIHHNKTAALITASLLLGLRLTNAAPAKFKIMFEVGQNLGLAFQAIDDILDATASAEVLGKTPGLDERHGKLTYASLYGLDVARAKARKLTAAAVRGAEKLGGDNWFLLELIKELEYRVN
ncbi:MAG TPA: farnesyl diphosphate synthase [Opitutales bacterium]|nr:farnesyl diphosphate synthase [Opitutales bacterium]